MKKDQKNHFWNIALFTRFNLTIYDGFFPSFESKSKCEYEDLRWAIQFTIDSIYTDRWTINTHAGELPPPCPGNCYINVFLIGLDGN